MPKNSVHSFHIFAQVQTSEQISFNLLILKRNLDFLQNNFYVTSTTGEKFLLTLDCALGLSESSDKPGTDASKLFGRTV